MVVAVFKWHDVKSLITTPYSKDDELLKWSTISYRLPETRDNCRLRGREETIAVVIGVWNEK